MPRELNVVMPVLQRNGFFAHTELILLSLLTNDDKQVEIDACNETRKIQYIVMIAFADSNLQL